MRRYLIKTFLLSLPVLLVLVSVNYWGDAASLFDNQYEAKIAAVLRTGSNVTNISANFDERIFQRELIKQTNIRPDIIIFGSSRTYLVNSEYYPGENLFNSSVVGAGIEDITAIYQLYKDKGMLPKKVLLNIDPWLFNASRHDNRWKSIAGVHHKFLSTHNITVEKNGDDDLDNKYVQLVSLSYFQSSLKNVRRRVISGDKPLPTNERYNHSSTRLSDGSFVYDKSFRASTTAEVEERVDKYIRGKVYGIEGFDTLSPLILDIFLAMINDMRQHEIEIVYFLAPYHPTAYTYVAQNYPQVLHTEALIKKLAAEKHATVIGSYDPGSVGLDKTDFYDGMHCNEAGIRKLMSGSAGQQPPLE